MAERQTSLETLLSCQVCFEGYEKDGDHVPRLLPCAHTVCNWCVGQLIQYDKLECPECRTKHQVTNRERTFPQNKYILSHFRKKPQVTDDKDEPVMLRKCAEHGKELNLFCKEPGCMMLICVSCSLKKHKKHEVAKIEEERINVKLEFERKIERVEKNLNNKIKKVANTKENLEKKTEASITDLRRQKDEAVRKFDVMIKRVEDEMAKALKNVNKDLSTMKENLVLVMSIKENNGEHGDWEEMVDKLETVKGIEQAIKGQFSGHRTYRYPEYTAAQKTMYGNVVNKEIDVDLSESVAQRTITRGSQVRMYKYPEYTGVHTGQETLSGNVMNEEIALDLSDSVAVASAAQRNITHASQLTCQGNI